jgi:hypothetical protein
MSNLSELSRQVAASLRDYLTAHWRSPEAYLVDLFQARDVVLLGEEHTIRHNLDLAHRLIPLLYAAGIYNFGMEFGAYEDQAALDALVTADHYDADLARRLMFNYNVGWAFQEYMDVYRVAWTLNRSLPPDARPFRVLNLSYKFNWADAPVVRTPENAARIYHQGPVDAFRAEIVRREILDKGEKILILTGTPHAFTRYRIPAYDYNAPNFVRFEDRNLGQLLYRMAPERVSCVLTHQPFYSKWQGGAQRVLPAHGIIDAVMTNFADKRAGFDLTDSPFGDLPDDSYYASGYADFRLRDLADGYIYDRPFAQFEGCTLDPSFLTEENWPEAQRQFPDPDWHRRPQSLDEYWAQIRAYNDMAGRYGDLR